MKFAWCMRQANMLLRTHAVAGSHDTLATPIGAGGEDGRPAGDATDVYVRACAFERLLRFANSPRFEPFLRAAYDEFWSRDFRAHPQAVQAVAFSRREATPGFIHYALLDAPARDGATIAATLLAEQPDLPSDEIVQLERFASTRIGLYHIEAVDDRNRLSAIDLWTNERVPFRAPGPDLVIRAGDALAARAILADDGTSEFAGAIYVCSLARAKRIVALLRRRWRAARRVDSTYSHERFLKRCAAVLINHDWFSTDADALPRAPQQSAALRPHVLAEVLGSASAPTAMDRSTLDGFLCAVACTPGSVQPAAWLPRIWGTQAPQFGSQRELDTTVGAIFALRDRICDAITAETFTPSLATGRSDLANNAAQRWCTGFIMGMRLDGAAWEPLENDPDSAAILGPIGALATGGEYAAGPLAETAETAAIALLVSAVQAIARYWEAGASSTDAARKALDLRFRRPLALARTRRTAATLHCLRIELKDVKPIVWRRIELASSTALSTLLRVLPVCMGWDGSRDRAIIVGRVRYEVADSRRPWGNCSKAGLTLRDIAPNARDHFEFHYDLGAGWRHALTVEAVVPLHDSGSPRCVAGARACPPEDCGGPSGYRELLTVLADHEHPDHDRLRTCVPAGFFAAAFDCATIERELGALPR